MAPSISKFLVLPAVAGLVLGCGGSGSASSDFGSDPPDDGGGGGTGGRIGGFADGEVGGGAMGGGGSATTPTTDAAPAVRHTAPDVADPSVIPLYDVFELSLTWPEDFGPQVSFFGVDVVATFTSPTGARSTVGGFYYDTLPNDESIWKVRFAPSEVGTWSYEYELTVPSDPVARRGTGSFEAVPSDYPGFLRINPLNPYRWQHDDGSPFAPLGLNVCMLWKDSLELDGGDKLGAFRADEQGRASVDAYLTAHGGAGFNLFRFSPDNCTTRIANDDLTKLLVEPAKDFDRYLRALRRHGFRTFYGLFGYHLPDKSSHPTPAELEYVTYSVNRWGAYVDVWELQNERNSMPSWIDPAAARVRAADPYDHPISTSWARPGLASIDVNAPHWYTAEPPRDSDAVTVQWADFWKGQAVKPVLVGEAGNKGEAWTPDSTVRARVRNWTAYFREIALVYWDASWVTNHTGLFIYLGNDERRQAHVLQRFSELTLRPESAELPLGLTDPTVRGYALASMEGVAAYLHHFDDHGSTASGVELTFDSPAAGVGRWIDPESGAERGTVAVQQGVNQLVAPDFAVDLAFFGRSSPLVSPPLALHAVHNAQDDGDADDDGLPNWGPANLPFGVAPLALVLDASDSYDPDGGAVTFAWDLGDGSPVETSAVVAHTFGPGLHFVKLVVTDDEGDTAHQAFLVRATADPNPEANDAPVLSLVGLEDVNVREGEPVVLQPRASDREIVSGSYQHFGDVSFVVQGLPPGARFFTEPGNAAFSWTPDFSQSGTWSVQFTARDAAGAVSATRTTTITVLDATPVPKATGTQANP
jgi:hypothetical protein